MLEGFTLIFILAIMGGIIAYLGDELGYKLGKKRLSIFGLRPKHTSTLISIFSGVIVVAVTMTFLSVASTNVRTALFGMEKLKKELQNMSSEVLSKSAELESAKNQLFQSEKELLEANVERDKANEHLDKVELASKQAYTDLAKYQNESRRLGVLRDNLQLEVSQLEITTQELQKGISDLRAGQVLFRANQVIYSGVIKAGQSEEETEDDLQNLLAYANRFVVDKLDLANKGAQIVYVSQDNFSKTVKILMEHNGEMAVRVQAVGNIMTGEPVLTEFFAVSNKNIYQYGQRIYEERVPANIDKNAAEEILVSFLSRLNAKVVQDGLLPDPVTGNVGDIDIPYMLEVVEKIRTTEGAFTITAVASKDIGVLGPLQIIFEINSLP